MAKTKTKVVLQPTKEVFIPRMSALACTSVGDKKYVKRRAKFAPQQLADGLTSGIVSDQANLVHGSFDEPGVFKVDPYCDIHTDKFALMQSQLDAVSVDPGSVPTPPSSVDNE